MLLSRLNQPGTANFLVFPKVKAGPNAKRFIERPTNHAALHQKFVSPNAGNSSSEVIPKKSKPENTVIVPDPSSGALNIDKAV